MSLRRSWSVAGWVLALLLAAGTSGLRAQDVTGRVTGKVLDASSAQTLPGAPVEVEGTDTVAHTDLDGAYVLDLRPGTYQVKVSFSGFRQLRRSVSVIAGQSMKLDFALSGSLAFSEEVVVAAEGPGAGSSQEAVLVERKRSGVISDVLAVEEMRRNADADAAAAMQRVTGVSVVDGQYVYVRGLGERYSNTTLNGAVLPTTEPDKRVVPLDLFPTGLIENVKVTKSYLPDRPADFAGGLVEIEPVNFPSEPTVSISMSTGWNSRATFQDVLGYSGGALDFLGFDDGTRALPGVIPAQKVSAAGIFGGGFSPAQLEQFGEAFDNIWTPEARTASPDSSLSILAGRSWGRLGAVASVSLSRSHKTVAEQQSYFSIGAGNAIEVQNQYDFEVASTKASLGAVLNLAWRFSGSHRVALENFYTHSGRDEARTFEGYNDDVRSNLRNQRLFFIEEGILSSQLSGEHFFPGLSNSAVAWSGTYSRADRDEPDLREVLYEFQEFTSSYILANESQSGLRMFNTLDDRVYDGKLDWTLLHERGGRGLASLKLGPQLTYRTRDFSSRRFRFVQRDVRGMDLTLAPEDLFTPANIGSVFEINEDTRATDTYEAEQTVLGGYAMVDWPLSGRLRAVGGARVERSEQRVTTFDLFNPSSTSIVSTLDNTDVLPAVNLIYSVTPNVNLRAAYSHNVNRPEFRELAPFEFTDVVGGRAVAGNPALKRALIRNADLRWEWFPAAGAAEAEVIAVSVFYKRFEDPIERVVEATAQLRTSFQNALGADNRGVELEARKKLGSLLVGVNYTYVSSEIELAPGVAQVQTSLNRPLAGQSKHLFNGMLEWRDQKGLSVRVLGGYFSDRIADVGALGLPDILERGRFSLDASAQKRLGHFTIRLTGDNLFDSETTFTQGGETQRLFRTGRTIALGCSWSL